MSTEAFQCKNAHWQNGEAVVLPPGRHRVDFKAARQESKRDDTISSIQLLHKTHEPGTSHNKSLESKVSSYLLKSSLDKLIRPNNIYFRLTVLTVSIYFVSGFYIRIFRTI